MAGPAGPGRVAPAAGPMGPRRSRVRIGYVRVSEGWRPVVGPGPGGRPGPARLAAARRRAARLTGRPGPLPLEGARREAPVPARRGGGSIRVRVIFRVGFHLKAGVEQPAVTAGAGHRDAGPSRLRQPGPGRFLRAGSGGSGRRLVRVGPGHLGPRTELEFRIPSRCSESLALPC